MHRSNFGVCEKGRRSARFLRVTALLMLAAIAVLSTGGLAAQTREPEVKVDAAEYDFGEVFTGESLVRAFTVRNIGAAPLELSQKISRSGRPALVYVSYAPQ